MAVARPKRLTASQLKGLIVRGGISSSEVNLVSNKKASVYVRKEEEARAEIRVAPIVTLSREKEVQRSFDSGKIDFVDYWQKSAGVSSFVGPSQPTKRPLATTVPRDVIKKRVTRLSNTIKSQARDLETERALIWAQENSSAVNPENEGQMLGLSARYRSLLGDQELTKSEHDSLNEQLRRGEDDDFRGKKKSVFAEEDTIPGIPTNEGVDYGLQKMQAEEDGIIPPSSSSINNDRTEESLIQSGSQMFGVQSAYADEPELDSTSRQGEQIIAEQDTSQQGRQMIENAIPGGGQKYGSMESTIHPWNAMLTGDDIAPKPNERYITTGTTSLTEKSPTIPQPNLPDGLNPVVQGNRPSNIADAVIQSANPDLGILTGSGYVQVSKQNTPIGQVQVDEMISNSSVDRITVPKTVEARIPSYLDPRSAEGQQIQRIYAEQIQTRIENEKQKAYFWRLTAGRASIAEALLKPRTTGNVVTPERIKNVNTFFKERGISLDEEMGSVKFIAKYDDAREATSAETMGDLRRFVTPDTFRRGQIVDGRRTFEPIIAKPSERENELERYESDLLNFYGGIPDPNAQQKQTERELSPESAEFLATQIADIKSQEGFTESEYFTVSYTKDGKTVDDTVSRINLELIVGNIVRSGNESDLTIAPSDATKSSSQYTGIIVGEKAAKLGEIGTDGQGIPLPPTAAGFLGGLVALPYLYADGTIPVSDKTVGISKQGIAVAPILTNIETSQTKVPKGFTLNEEGILEPNAELPAGEFGYTAPLENIKRLGEAVYEKGATMDALEGITYYDTFLDRNIGVFVSAFKGAPIKEDKKEGLDWWFGAATNTGVAIKYVADNPNVAVQNMAKASKEWSDDFMRNPRYYLETAVTDAATFITPGGIAVAGARGGIAVASVTAKTLTGASKISSTIKATIKAEKAVPRVYDAADVLQFGSKGVDAPFLKLYQGVYRAEKEIPSQVIGVISNKLLRKGVQGVAVTSDDIIPTFGSKFAPEAAKQKIDPRKTVIISGGEITSGRNPLITRLLGVGTTEKEAAQIANLFAKTEDATLSRRISTFDVERQLDQLAARDRALLNIDESANAEDISRSIERDVLAQSERQSSVATIRENIQRDLIERRRGGIGQQQPAPHVSVLNLQEQLSSLRFIDDQATLPYRDPLSTQTPILRELNKLPENISFTRQVYTPKGNAALPGSTEIRYAGGERVYVDGSTVDDFARVTTPTFKQPIGGIAKEEARAVYDPRRLEIESPKNFKIYSQLEQQQAEIQGKLAKEGAYFDNMGTLVKDNEGRLVLYRGTSKEQAYKSFGMDDSEAIGPRQSQGVGIQARSQTTPAAARWNEWALAFGSPQKGVSRFYGGRSTIAEKKGIWNADKNRWEDGATGKGIDVEDFEIVKYTIAKDANVVTRNEILVKMKLIDEEDLITKADIPPPSAPSGLPAPGQINVGKTVGGAIYDDTKPIPALTQSEITNIFFDNIDKVKKYAIDNKIDVIHGTMNKEVSVVGKRGPQLPSGFPKPGQTGALESVSRNNPYFVSGVVGGEKFETFTSIESTIINPKVIESRALVGEQAVLGSAVVDSPSNAKIVKLLGELDQTKQKMRSVLEQSTPISRPVPIGPSRGIQIEYSGKTVVSPTIRLTKIGEGKKIRTYDKETGVRVDKETGDTKVIITEIETDAFPGLFTMVTEKIPLKTGRFKRFKRGKTEEQTTIVQSVTGKQYDREIIHLVGEKARIDESIPNIQELGTFGYSKQTSKVETEGYNLGGNSALERFSTSGKPNKMWDNRVTTAEAFANDSEILRIMKNELRVKQDRLKIVTDNIKSLGAEDYKALINYQYTSRAKKILPITKKPYVTYNRAGEGKAWFSDTKGELYRVEVNTEGKRMDLRNKFITERDGLKADIDDILVPKLKQQNIDEMSTRLAYAIELDPRSLDSINAAVKYDNLNNSQITTAKLLKRQQVALQIQKENNKLLSGSKYDDLTFEQRQIIDDNKSRLDNLGSKFKNVKESDVEATKLKLSKIKNDRVVTLNKFYEFQGDIHPTDIQSFRKLLADQTLTKDIDYVRLSEQYRKHRILKVFEAGGITRKHKDLLIGGKRATKVDKGVDPRYNYKSYIEQKRQYEEAVTNQFEFEKSLTSGDIQATKQTADESRRLATRVVYTQRVYGSITQDLWLERAKILRQDAGFVPKQMSGQKLDEAFKLVSEKRKSLQEKGITIVDDIAKKKNQLDETERAEGSIASTRGYAVIGESTPAPQLEIINAKTVLDDLKELRLQKMEQVKLSKQNVENFMIKKDGKLTTPDGKQKELYNNAVKTLDNEQKALSETNQAVIKQVKEVKFLKDNPPERVVAGETIKIDGLSVNNFGNIIELERYHSQNLREIISLENKLGVYAKTSLTKNNLKTRRTSENAYRRETQTAISEQIDKLRNKEKLTKKEVERIKVLETQFTDVAFVEVTDDLLDRFILKKGWDLIAEPVDKKINLARKVELQREVAIVDKWKLENKLTTQSKRFQKGPTGLLRPVVTPVDKSTFIQKSRSALSDYTQFHGDKQGFTRGLEILEEDASLVGQRVSIDDRYIKIGKIVDDINTNKVNDRKSIQVALVSTMGRQKMYEFTEQKLLSVYSDTMMIGKQKVRVNAEGNTLNTMQFKQKIIDIIDFTPASGVPLSPADEAIKASASAATDTWKIKAMKEIKHEKGQEVLKSTFRKGDDVESIVLKESDQIEANLIFETSDMQRVMNAKSMKEVKVILSDKNTEEIFGNHKRLVRKSDYDYEDPDGYIPSGDKKVILTKDERLYQSSDDLKKVMIKKIDDIKSSASLQEAKDKAGEIMKWTKFRDSRIATHMGVDERPPSTYWARKISHKINENKDTHKIYFDEYTQVTSQQAVINMRITGNMEKFKLLSPELKAETELKQIRNAESQMKERQVKADKINKDITELEKEQRKNTTNLHFVDKEWSDVKVALEAKQGMIQRGGVTRGQVNVYWTRDKLPAKISQKEYSEMQETATKAGVVFDTGKSPQAVEGMKIYAEYNIEGLKINKQIASTVDESSILNIGVGLNPIMIGSSKTFKERFGLTGLRSSTSKITDMFSRNKIIRERAKDARQQEIRDIKYGTGSLKPKIGTTGVSDDVDALFDVRATQEIRAEKAKTDIIDVFGEIKAKKFKLIENEFTESEITKIKQYNKAKKDPNKFNQDLQIMSDRYEDMLANPAKIKEYDKIVNRIGDATSERQIAFNQLNDVSQGANLSDIKSVRNTIRKDEFELGNINAKAVEIIDRSDPANKIYKKPFETKVPLSVKDKARADLLGDRLSTNRLKLQELRDGDVNANAIKKAEDKLRKTEIKQSNAIGELEVKYLTDAGTKSSRVRLETMDEFTYNLMKLNERTDELSTQKGIRNVLSEDTDVIASPMIDSTFKTTGGGRGKTNVGKTRSSSDWANNYKKFMLEQNKVDARIAKEEYTQLQKAVLESRTRQMNKEKVVGAGKSPIDIPPPRRSETKPLFAPPPILPQQQIQYAYGEEQTMYPPGSAPPSILDNYIKRPLVITPQKTSGFLGQPEIGLIPKTDPSRVMLPPSMDSIVKSVVLPKLDSGYKLQQIPGLKVLPKTSLILDPKLGTKLITPQLTATVLKPKLATIQIQDQPLLQKQLAIIAVPPRTGRDVLPRAGIAPFFLPPYYPPTLKKPLKKLKKKKTKKKKIAWAVPDVWFGYYDPQEYKVISGKGDKLPDWLSTGLD